MKELGVGRAVAAWRGEHGVVARTRLTVRPFVDFTNQR